MSKPWLHPCGADHNATGQGVRVLMPVQGKEAITPVQCRPFQCLLLTDRKLLIATVKVNLVWRFFLGVQRPWMPASYRNGNKGLGGEGYFCASTLWRHYQSRQLSGLHRNLARVSELTTLLFHPRCLLLHSHSWATLKSLTRMRVSRVTQLSFFVFRDTQLHFLVNTEPPSGAMNLCSCASGMV